MNWRIEPLPPPLFPLLDKFYREQRSHMRVARARRAWAVRGEQGLVGGVCLTPVATGHWLTSLLIAPAARGRGVASDLLCRVRADTSGAIWLFCHPELEGFYRRSGYVPCETLPEELAQRLARYTRTKALMAMVSPATSD